MSSRNDASATAGIARDAMASATGIELGGVEAGHDFEDGVHGGTPGSCSKQLLPEELVGNEQTAAAQHCGTADPCAAMQAVEDVEAMKIEEMEYVISHGGTISQQATTYGKSHRPTRTARHAMAERYATKQI